MNIKMAINSQLSTIESKRQTKQASKHNTNRIINTDIIWRVISGEKGGGEMGKWCRDQEAYLVGTK